MFEKVHRKYTLKNNSSTSVVQHKLLIYLQYICRRRRKWVYSFIYSVFALHGRAFSNQYRERLLLKPAAIKASWRGFEKPFFGDCYYFSFDGKLLRYTSGLPNSVLPCSFHEQDIYLWTFEYAECFLKGFILPFSPFHAESPFVSKRNTFLHLS